MLLQDKALRGQMAFAGDVEAYSTAAVIANLKQAKKSKTVLLLDRTSGGAKQVARCLAEAGFGQTFVVQGGFEVCENPSYLLLNSRASGRAVHTVYSLLTVLVPPTRECSHWLRLAPNDAGLGSSWPLCDWRTRVQRACEISPLARFQVSGV